MRMGQAGCPPHKKAVILMGWAGEPTPQESYISYGMGRRTHPTRKLYFLWDGQENPPHKKAVILMGWAGEPTPQESYISCGAGILPAKVFTLFISTYLLILFLLPSSLTAK
jgi:hypothetical protein